MSHFEFVIPLQKDELCNSSRGEYKVEHILSPEEIKGAVERAIETFKEEGCMYILDHFDTLYSVLVHFSRMTWSLISRIFDKLIIGSLNQMSYILQATIEDVPDQDTRTRSLNILKMNLYVFTQLHSCTHDRISFENIATLTEKGKGKKTKKGELEDNDWDWDNIQRLAFISLYNLLQLNINKLWDPPIPDEQFINMCANCSYKSLEHPTIAHVRQKPLRETLFQVIGTLVKKYTHGISCVVKFVQLLTLYEHVVSPLAQGVVMFVQELGMKSLVNEIIRELMSSTDTAQDTSSVRSFSNFLVEIAELEPQIMVPATKELMKYLNDDPYTMRCCVLSVLTEILLSQMSHGELDDVAREQRDIYLELLEEHSTDSNAFVRSRVLQLWLKIVLQNAVPKMKFVKIVDLALERVTDKSSNVCKHAIILLTALLEHNPFGIQLDIQELANRLLIAEKTLQDLETKIGTFKNITREKTWETIQPEVIIYLSSIISPCDAEKKECPMTELLTEERLKENIETVAVFLTNGQYEQAYNIVREIEVSLQADKTIKSEMPTNNNIDYYVTIMRELFMKYPHNPSEEESTSPEINGDNPEPSETNKKTELEEELKIQNYLVDYLKDWMKFSKQVEEAVNNVIMVLYEESVTEVLEAITFLTTIYKFGFPKAEKGVQELLRLMLRKEPAIKEAVNAAYSTFYLTVDNLSKTEKAIEEVNRLSKLVSSVDYGQLEALAILVVGWLKNKKLGEEFVSILWDRVKSQNIERFHKQSALILLGMVTQEFPAMAKTQLCTLINHGLRVDCSDPRDLYTVIFTCRTISNISLCKSGTEEQRFSPKYDMFPLLLNIIRESFTRVEGSETFIKVAKEAIDIIMEFCLDPRDICNKLLCDLFEIMTQDNSPADADDGIKTLLQNETKTELSESLLHDTTALNTGITNVSDKEDKKSAKTFVSMETNTDTFLRFLFLVGHVAFKHAQFLENYYLEELKQKFRKNFNALSPSKDSSTILEISRRSGKFKQTKGEEELMTELDLIAAADDTATDEVRRILEHDVVCGEGVVAGFSLLIIDVCKNPKKYQNPILLSLAATAFAQIMMVSSEFCSKHMQLLVTMLEKSNQESVRVSLVVAFGDLLFKFPNTVEPWTRFLYARLRDESRIVRLNTLLVLSHLVTNEMVKMKGQISEVAMCIVDENEEIADLAKRFFSDLSQKGNTLFNALPDIISHLSNPASDIPVDEKNFEIILRYIMDQIQKEKQLENLVEKLCKRIKESVCERQWKDLAFCLSLLPWSYRSLRWLVDHAYCFCDRLLYQPVATHFLSIVTSAMRSTKPGLKEIGAELKTVIDEVITKGSADHLHEPEDKVSDLPSIPTKTPAKYSRKTPRKTPAKTGNKKTAKKVKKAKYCSDSEDDNDNGNSDKSGDEGEVFKAPQKTRSGRTAVKLF